MSANPVRTALVTFVSYCSRDSAFIGDIIANARKFSDLVVVSLGTRLYTGEREDVDAEVERIVGPYRQEEEEGCPVIAVVYEVHEAALSEPIALHNQAREVGLAAARRALSFSRPFWALLLDGDEVPDGARFKTWWEGSEGDGVRSGGPRVAYKMANRWAFLHPRLVAEELEDSVLLVHSDALLNRDALVHPRERDGIYMWHLTSPLGMRDMRVERRVASNLVGSSSNPLFTHYSWVRDPEAPDMGRSALKAKCANWGHRNDRDWTALIDGAFDAIESGRWPERDFVHGYQLRMMDHDPRTAVDAGRI